MPRRMKTAVAIDPGEYPDKIGLRFRARRLSLAFVGPAGAKVTTRAVVQIPDGSWIFIDSILRSNCK